MLREVNTSDRLSALKTHRKYLLSPVGQQNDNPLVAAELKRVEEFLTEMDTTVKNPRGRWVSVLKSRVVKEGAVGRVVYADEARNYVRVEFGDGERISCAMSNVEIIDWIPLPPMIPMVGERVLNTVNNEEMVVVEWMTSQVRVQPPGRNEDTYYLDRAYVRRKESVLQM